MTSLRRRVTSLRCNDLTSMNETDVEIMRLEVFLVDLQKTVCCNPFIQARWKLPNFLQNINVLRRKIRNVYYILGLARYSK